MVTAWGGALDVVDLRSLSVEMRHEQRPSLMMRLWQSIQTFISYLLTVIRQPQQAVEALLVALVAVWAVALLYPQDLFSTAPTYKNMAALGSQLRWGIAATMTALMWLVSTRTRNSTLRALALLSIINWFAFLMVLFASVNPVGFGALSHGVFFAFAVWSLWRYAGRKRDEL